MSMEQSDIMGTIPAALLEQNDITGTKDIMGTMPVALLEQNDGTGTQYMMMSLEE